jgi:[acyl-carrier-protein] S-malonyltransferase
MFPGQSSLYPEMIEKLLDLRPRNWELLARASERLGRNLRVHYRASNAEIFATNRDIQLGVFLANQMFLELLNDGGVHADLSLGLSLGEYSHLVHIGALRFEDALSTVDARGRAYDAGPAGAMASVFPISADDLQQVVDRCQGLGVIEIVNRNSPRQQVLSGQRQALDLAISILRDEYYLEPVIIEEKVPMHSSIFAPVAVAFSATLQHVPFRQPELPYISNLTGRIQHRVSAEMLRESLRRHVYSPVLWRNSIDAVIESYPDAAFVEVGPKAVLYNLLDKKWHRVAKWHVDSVENTASELAGLIETLARQVTVREQRNVV